MSDAQALFGIAWSLCYMKYQYDCSYIVGPFVMRGARLLVETILALECIRIKSKLHSVAFHKDDSQFTQPR